jgi:hypothetical protein
MRLGKARQTNTWGIQPRQSGYLERSLLILGRWLLHSKPLCAALLLLPGVVLGLAAGAERGYWGEPLRVAWHNEQVAQENVGVGLGVLRDWDAQEPSWFRIESKKKGAPVALTHEAWKRERAEIEAKIDVQRAGVSAWWWPLGAEQPEGWTRDHRYGWALVYHAHHFIARTPLGCMCGVVLLSALGMAFFDRRRRQREECARLEREQREAAEREAYERRRQAEQRHQPLMDRDATRPDARRPTPTEQKPGKRKRPRRPANQVRRPRTK